MIIKTSLGIIVAEYALVFLTTLLWFHLHTQTGYLPFLAYAMYLWGNMLVLGAACLQIAVLVQTALERLSHPPATWLRILLLLPSLLGGVALAWFYQRGLNGML